MEPFFFVVLFPVGASPLVAPNGGATQVQIASVIRGHGIPQAVIARALRSIADQLDPPQPYVPPMMVVS